MTEMICLFVDTSIDTHLVLGLQEDDDIFILKEKISNTHLECFPHYGRITVSSLKMKGRGHYYHLSDSAPFKIYHFMNNTDGHIFVDVVNEEKAKQNTKKMKSLELPSMDPSQSGDLGNGERNDVDADLVIIEDDEKDLEHDLKLVDDMVEKKKDDLRLGRIKKVHKIGIKGKSEKGASGSKPLKPRKTKTLNKFKTLI